MSQPIPATLAPREAASRPWDVVIAGAGIAGSMTARQVALAGARVLLVDRAAFPRDKVCGCCLNGSAVSSLRHAGLGRMLDALGPRPVHRFDVSAHGSSASLELAGGLAVSRTALDAALVLEAVRAGAHFIPGCAASLGPRDGRGCIVSLRSAHQSADTRASAAVAADGLGGRFLDAIPQFREHTAPRSRFGAATAIPASGFDDDAIAMTCGPGGYVGIVRLENGLLKVAAAFDPAFVRGHGGPGPAAAALLANAGRHVPPGLSGARWKGTPALTRRRKRVQVGRAFALGDAAGYIEPFTGEGMAWAITSALAAAPCILRAAAGDHRAQWPQLHRSLVRRRQAGCRIIASVLRSPSLAAAAVRLVSWSSVPVGSIVGRFARTPLVGGVR